MNTNWNEKFIKDQKRILNEMYEKEQRQLILFNDLIYSLDIEINNLMLNLTSPEKKTNILQLKFLLDEKNKNKLIKNIKIFLKDIDLKKSITKELTTINRTSRITHLNAIRAIISMKTIETYARLDDALKHDLNNIYIDTQGRTIYEIATGFNKALEWNMPSETYINTVLNRNWSMSNMTFSENIWKEQKILTNILVNEIEVGFIRGFDINTIKKNINSRIIKTSGISTTGKGTSAEFRARRVAHTEIAYLSETARHDSFKKLDVEKYEIDATLDKNTCEICKGEDKKVYTMDKYLVGETAPPFHPFCRCVTVPALEDFEGSERFARDKDGNPIYVPGNMKYSEYFDKYLS